MEKQNVRAHNLSVKQPHLQDHQPANDGFKDDLADTSDRIRVGVTNGKEGSVESKNVASFSKSHG